MKNLKKYILTSFFILLANYNFAQRISSGRTDELMIFEDEYLIKEPLLEDLYNNQPKNIVTEYFDLNNINNFSSNNTVVSNYLNDIFAANVIKAKWEEEQRIKLKNKIDEIYNIKFPNYEKAVEKLFADNTKKRERFSHNKNVIKNNYSRVKESAGKKAETNLRELQHLKIRKEELTNGNINNSLFDFTEANGTRLKDIKDLNTLNSKWNIVSNFTTINFATKENANLKINKVNSLNTEFDSYMATIQKDFFNGLPEEIERLYLVALEVHLYNYLLHKPVISFSDLLNYPQVPSNVWRVTLFPKVSEKNIESYLNKYAKKSVFDESYWENVLDKNLVINGFQPVFGEIFKISNYIRAALLSQARATANIEKETTLNNLINAASLEDIKADLAITGLGPTNLSFLNNKPSLKAEVTKYFKVNNFSKYSHDGINWLLKNYFENNVFPVNENLYKSKSTPLFQDANNPNRAIKIDYIPQAVTEGITNFGNVVAELLKDNVNPEFEGSYIRAIFEANGLNVNGSILNEWLGQGFNFISNDGKSFEIVFDNNINLPEVNYTRGQIELEGITKNIPWKPSTGKIANLKYTHSHFDGSRGYYKLENGAIVVNSSSEQALTTSGDLRDKYNTYNPNARYYYIKLPGDEWAEMLFNPDNLADGLANLFRLGAIDLGKNIGRYALPIEDIIVLINGKDFDGQEASRLKAAGFLLLAIVPGSKGLKIVGNISEAAFVAVKIGNKTFVIDTVKTGLLIVTESNIIKFLSKRGEEIARVIDGILTYKYKGFGGYIVTKANKTTTLIGKWENQLENIWKTGLVKHGENIGGLNILGNLPPNFSSIPVSQIWTNNKIWLNRAISRGDIIRATANPLDIKNVFHNLDAINPNKFINITTLKHYLLNLNPAEIEQLGYFGREIRHLFQNGYNFNTLTKTFTK